MVRKAAGRSWGNRLYLLFHHLILSLMFLVFLVPLLNIVSSSFSSPNAVMTRKVTVLPVDFTLQAYRDVLNTAQLWLGFRNSILYTSCSTVLALALIMLAAYPLSRRELRGRKVISIYLMITMLFSGGLIPTYLLVRSLGLLNTRAAMIIPGVFAVWYVFVARSFLSSSIPTALYDAAEIDGCDHFWTLVQVVLPLSKALIAVIVLFNAVQHWNAYFNALIYLQDYKLYPLQLIIRELLFKSSEAFERILTGSQDLENQFKILARLETIKYAIVLVATIPSLLIFPFAQRHFRHGVMIGSLSAS